MGNEKKMLAIRSYFLNPTFRLIEVQEIRHVPRVRFLNYTERHYTKSLYKLYNIL